MISDNIINGLPHFYNTVIGSKLRAVIDAIAEEMAISSGHIERNNNMIGINNTNGEDLYTRWGSLFKLPRQPGESDDAYRTRLKLSIISLAGGTSYAIQYSIAAGLGISNDSNAMNDRIKVYDAWECPVTIDGTQTGFGNTICIIDLDYQTYDSNYETMILNAINNVKASGVNVQFAFTNYSIIFYSELDMTYSSLSNIKYYKLGGE